MDTIKIPCDCGHILNLRKLSYLTKESLIKLLDTEPIPAELLNPLRPESNKRLSLNELIEVLKLWIRPVEIECQHCHKVTNLNKKLVPKQNFTVKPYNGYDRYRFGPYPSFNG